MFAVSLLECGLLILCERAGGGGDADVGDKIAELELEVSVRDGVVLSPDLNALDRYKEGLNIYESAVLERLCILEYFGIVSGSDLFLVFVEYLNGAVLYLVSAAVNILYTADSDGHTDLKFVVGHGVGRHLVGVVSAVAVLEVDAVVRCTLRLCDDTGDDTPDGDSLIGSLGYVFSPRKFLEFRKRVVEDKLFGVAGGVLYGSLKLVHGILGGVGVEFDLGLLVFIVDDEFDIVCRAGGHIDRPLNGEFGLADEDHIHYGVACGGHFRAVLVHCSEVALRVLQCGGRIAVVSRGSSAVIAVIGSIIASRASGEGE